MKTLKMHSVAAWILVVLTGIASAEDKVPDPVGITAAPRGFEQLAEITIDPRPRRGDMDDSMGALFLIRNQPGRFVRIAVAFERDFDPYRVWVSTIDAPSWERWSHLGAVRGALIALPLHHIDGADAGHFVTHVRLDFNARKAKPFKATLWGERAPAPPPRPGFDPTGWEYQGTMQTTLRHRSTSIGLGAQRGQCAQLALVSNRDVPLGVDSLEVVLDRGVLKPRIGAIEGSAKRPAIIDIPAGRYVKELILHYRNTKLGLYAQVYCR